MKRDPNCQRCPLYKTAEYVCLLGNGAVPAVGAIVGEAPGHREDTSGEPFVGRAGQLLRKLLDKVGVKSGDIFITNAVSCRPPDNRTPRPREIEACRYWFDYQMRKVKPKVVLLLGNTPLKAVLGLKGIKKLRGKPVERDGVVYLPTFHPSYILRNLSPNQPDREAFEADLALFAEIIQRGGTLPTEKGLRVREIHTKEEFDEFLDDLHGTVSFDTETSCLYPWAKSVSSEFYDKPTITALGFATKRYQWVIPFNHYKVHPFDEKEQFEMVRRITLKLKHCILVAHNGKFDQLWVKVMYGVDWPIDFDTMLAHYNLDENQRHGLKKLSKVYFGALDYDLDPTVAPWAELSKYLALDVLYTRKLRFLLGKKLYKEGDSKRVFELITMPCSALYAEAEENGVYINESKFEAAEKYLREEIAAAEKALHKYGKDVNWRSTKQVGHILFEKLGLPIISKTPKGAPQCNESVLNRLDHPIGSEIIRLRGANQQLSFFIEGWKPFLVNRRIHPSFKIHGTVTGRPSCEHPNLQQTPRDPRIRSLITAPDGWELVEFDLSQIELRIAAELSNEKTMLDTFFSGRDIHWQTAIREIERTHALEELVVETGSLYLKKRVTYPRAIQALKDMGHKQAIAIKSDWKEVRKKAKAVNFGYLYGMWWKKFIIYARDNYGVIVNSDDAQASRKAYFELYDGLPDWHIRQKRYARRNGYVTTLTGRRRRLTDAQLTYDCFERAEAERQAINSPVQGFAAELTLMGGLEMRERYDSRRELRIVGSVHDAILTWIRRNKLKRIVPEVLDIMAQPKLLKQFDIRLKVPILAEAAIGPWSEGVELEEFLCSK